MIFGKTNTQRRLEERAQEQWHTWFAWRPVRLTHGDLAGKVVWLKNISRARYTRWCHEGPDFEWHYWSRA